MSLNAFAQEMLPALDTALRQRINAALREDEGLRAMLAYHMGWEGNGAGADTQGKRVRPLLLLLCAAACGADWHAALPAAEAVELVHNFSLIHDDIQDASPLRHGRPTLWKQHGMALAINAGDAMFSLAQLAVLDLGEPLTADQTNNAARLLNQTCLRLTQGQHLDLSYEQMRNLDLNDYQRMIDGKTAALLETSTALGALTGGANQTIRDAFARFGRSLGLAFQAQDDYLGIWGELERTGKSNESDLVAGKKSLPVVYGLAQRGAFYSRWLQGPVAPVDVPGVIALLEQAGSHIYTQETAQRLTGDALDALKAATPEGSPAAQALEEMAHTLLARQS